MKKIFTLIVLFALGISWGHAYDFLCFYKTNGDVESIGVSGLTIKISGVNLVAENSKSESLTIPLVSLNAMEFTDSKTGNVQNISSVSKNSSFSVFSLDGLFMGNYENMEAAQKQLDAGIYVINNSEGESVKIRVGK